MIVVFGASTDIGRRLCVRLSAAGYATRPVSRLGVNRADLLSGQGVREVLADADVVVSCAHAKFTPAILDHCAPMLKSLVLTGSAWRYSQVPNPRADQVRDAEALFLRCQYNGVMLHPTMIYGGAQENNIKRLLTLIDRLPVIPAPGGGNNLVQPIYVDDVVECLFSATTLSWQEKHVIPLGGQSLRWREMAQICARSIGRSKPILNVPIAPVVALLSLLNKLGGRKIDSDVVRRFGENVDVSTEDMTRLLAVRPRDFERGMALAIRDWRNQGVLSL